MAEGAEPVRHSRIGFDIGLQLSATAEDEPHAFRDRVAQVGKHVWPRGFELERVPDAQDVGVELELQLDESGRAFAKALVDRTVAGAGKVDELIIGASRNWRLERMSRVDRNILRLGTAELMPHGDGDASVATPVRIVINEAIELAKRFGTAESAAFVNGILDRIAGALGRGPES